MSEERGPKYLAKCNISVLGLSGTLGIGVGKSALCSRFTRPDAELYELHGEDHSSIISTSDFREPEVNGEHYAFFGRLSLPYPNAETELRVSVVEHTTFIDEATMAPFRVGKPYTQRAMAEKLKSSGRVQYECRSTIGGSRDSDRLKFPDEFHKRGVDGYVFVMDPTAQAEARQAQLDVLAECAKKLPKRKQLVVVLAKCDALPVDVQDRLRDGFSVLGYFGAGGGDAASSKPTKQAKYGGQLADLPVFFSSARHKVCVDEAFCYVAHITQNLTGLVRRPAPFLHAYEARRQFVHRLRTAAVDFLRQSEAVQASDDWGSKKQQLMAVDCFRALLFEAGISACSEVVRMRLVEQRLILNGHSYRIMAKESTADLVPSDFITLVPEVRRDVCDHLDLRMYMHKAEEFQAALLLHNVSVPKMEDVFGGKPRLVRLGTVPMQLSAGEGVAASASAAGTPQTPVQPPAALPLPQPVAVKPPPPVSPSKSLASARFHGGFGGSEDRDDDGPPVPLKRYTPGPGSESPAATTVDARPALAAPTSAAPQAAQSTAVSGEDENLYDMITESAASARVPTSRTASISVKAPAGRSGLESPVQAPAPFLSPPPKAKPPAPVSPSKSIGSVRYHGGFGSQDHDSEDAPPVPVKRYTPDAGIESPADARPAAASPKPAAPPAATRTVADDGLYDTIGESAAAAVHTPPPPHCATSGSFSSGARLTGGGGTENKSSDAVWERVSEEQLKEAREKRPPPVSKAPPAAQSPIRRPQRMAVYADVRDLDMPMAGDAAAASPLRSASMSPTSATSNSSGSASVGAPLAGSGDYDDVVIIKPYTSSQPVRSPNHFLGSDCAVASSAAGNGGSPLDAEPLYDAVAQSDDRQAQVSPPETPVDVLYDVVRQEDFKDASNGDDVPDFLPPPMDLDSDPESAEEFPEPSVDLPPPPMELMDDEDDPGTGPPDEWAPPPPENVAYCQPLDAGVESMPEPAPVAEQRPQSLSPDEPGALPVNYEDVSLPTMLAFSPTGEHGVVRRSSEARPPAAKQQQQPKHSAPSTSAPWLPAAQSYEDADMLRPTPLFAARLARDAGKDSEPSLPSTRPGYEMPTDFQQSATGPAPDSAPVVRDAYDTPVEFKVSQLPGPGPGSAPVVRAGYDTPVDFKINQQAASPAPASASASASDAVPGYEMPVDLSASRPVASAGPGETTGNTQYCDANFVRPTEIFARKLAQDAQRSAASPQEQGAVRPGYEAPLSYTAGDGDVQPYGSSVPARSTLYDTPLDEPGVASGGGSGAPSGGGNMKKQFDSTSSLAQDMAYLEAMLENSTTFGALLGVGPAAGMPEERPYDSVPLSNSAPPDERAPIPPPTGSMPGQRPFHILSKSLHNDETRPKVEVQARSTSTMPSGAERQRPTPAVRQGSEDRPSMPLPSAKPGPVAGTGDVPPSNNSFKNNSNASRPAAAKKLVTTVSNNTRAGQVNGSSSTPAKPAFRGKPPVEQPSQSSPKPGPKPAPKSAPQAAPKQGSSGVNAAGRVGSFWWETPPSSPATPQRSDAAASAHTNGSVPVSPVSSESQLAAKAALRRKSSYENIGQPDVGRGAPGSVDPTGALPGSGRGRRVPLTHSASIDEQRVTVPQPGDVVVTASRPPVMRKRTASSSSQQRP